MEEFIKQTNTFLVQKDFLAGLSNGTVLEIALLLSLPLLLFPIHRRLKNLWQKLPGKWAEFSQRVSFPLLLTFSWAVLHAVMAYIGASPLLLQGGSVVAFIWALARAINFLEPPKPAGVILLVALAGVVFLKGADLIFLPLGNVLSSISFGMGENKITLLLVVKALFLFGVLAWGCLSLGKILEQDLSRRRVKPAARTLLLKLFRIFGFALAALVTLNTIGLNLSSLAIFGGALGIGLGFGLQTITSNFISGILLLLDKSIKPGDVVSVDDTFGQVIDMRARYLVLRRRDGMEVLIPNEQFIGNQVINWSFSSKAVRQEVTIGVSYASDMEAVQEILLEAVKGVPRVREKPDPKVFIKEFADSSVVFAVRYWMEDPEDGVTNLKGDVNMALWKALKAHNIDIPFPQLVVHKTS